MQVTRKLVPSVKKLWIEKLRSDEYEQGTHCLRYNGKYCCLGVLSDLAVKAGVVEDVKAFGDHIDAINQYPLDTVATWAFGVEVTNKYTDRPSEPWEVDIGTVANLGRLNDSGLSFRELADIIEEKL